MNSINMSVAEPISGSCKSPLLWLLFYSLIPGFAKALESPELLVLNIPIVLILLRGAIIWKRPFSLLLCSYLFYSFILSVIYVIIGYGNKISIITSIYMYLFPMVAAVSLNKYRDEVIIKAVAILAAVHATIGFLIYGFIEYPGIINEMIIKIKDGVFPFRMASVSGSLGLGVLCPVGLICSIYLAVIRKQKVFTGLAWLIFLAGVMTQQRSSWFVMALFLTWHASKNFLQPAAFLVLVTLAVLILGDDTLEFMSDRALSLNKLSMITERLSVWEGTFSNIASNPFGLGLGQAGLIAHKNGVNAQYGISDGDYFRIASETGVVGAFFVIALTLMLMICNWTARTQLEKYMSWIPISISVQMLGSNVTEFYFVSYLFWFFCGFLLIRRRFSPFLSGKDSGRAGRRGG